jgi:hypothetical protein
MTAWIFLDGTSGKLYVWAGGCKRFESDSWEACVEFCARRAFTLATISAPA